MAAITVSLPGPLRRFASGAHEIAVEGADVGEALASLSRAEPALADRILDDEGRPRRFLRLFLNDQDILSLGHLTTPLAAGDRLAIVVAVAGG